MNTACRRVALARCAPVILAAAAWLPALGADPTAAAAARSVYEAERAACIRGESNQDRETCLKEAAAAYAEARRGALPGDTTQLKANATRRCDALPPADRKDCLARMAGQGTTSGSAAGGGIYRELVTREVGAPASGPEAHAK